MDALIGQWCSRCKNFKADFAFYSPTDSWCKACRSESMKQRRLNDPAFNARRKAYNEKYWQEMKADPVAMEVYREKQNKRQKHKKYQSYNTEYMRKKRNEIRTRNSN